MYRSKLSPTFNSFLGMCVVLLWAAGCGTEAGGHGELEEQARVSAALSSATDQDIAAGGGVPLAKVTLTVNVDAGSQNSLSGIQMRVSSSHPAFLVGIERGAALADGEIAVEETEGDSTTVVTLSFGAGQPAMSGPVAELTYQLQEGCLGDSRLDCFVQPRGEDPGPSSLDCALTSALDGSRILLQGDPGVRGLRGVSPALDGGRIRLQDDPDPKFDR